MDKQGEKGSNAPESNSASAKPPPKGQPDSVFRFGKDLDIINAVLLGMLPANEYKFPDVFTSFLQSSSYVLSSKSTSIRVLMNTISMKEIKQPLWLLLFSMHAMSLKPPSQVPGSDEPKKFYVAYADETVRRIEPVLIGVCCLYTSVRDAFVNKKSEVGGRVVQLLYRGCYLLMLHLKASNCEAGNPLLSEKVEAEKINRTKKEGLFSKFSVKGVSSRATQISNRATHGVLSGNQHSMERAQGNEKFETAVEKAEWHDDVDRWSFYVYDAERPYQTSMVSLARGFEALALTLRGSELLSEEESAIITSLPKEDSVLTATMLQSARKVPKTFYFQGFALCDTWRDVWYDFMAAAILMYFHESDAQFELGVFAFAKEPVGV